MQAAKSVQLKEMTIEGWICSKWLRFATVVSGSLGSKPSFVEVAAAGKKRARRRPSPRLPEGLLSAPKRTCVRETSEHLRLAISAHCGHSTFNREAPQASQAIPNVRRAVEPRPVMSLGGAK